MQRCINALKPLGIHETFPAYLHLRHQAARFGRFTRLGPDWMGEPHDWLDMPGGPPNKPHFRPFTSRGSSPNSYWMNDNLPGSYARSSLRSKATLYLDANDEYLLPTHADQTPDPAPILSDVLLGNPVPAWAVAGFLYRNRSFTTTSPATPGWRDLVEVFRTEFQWTDEEAKTLFEWTVPDGDAFEEVQFDA